MSYTVPYASDTVRISNDVLPGNRTADDPVEFDIVPAWGADLARIKSILVACSGLGDNTWQPELQSMVIAGFDTGAAAFVNVVTAVRGLKIPMAMAVRAGIVPAMPPEPAKATDLVPITTGEQYGRVAGHTSLMAMTIEVAIRISQLSKHQQVDPRLFVQPSGSGGAATGSAMTSTAVSARRTSRRRATAAGSARVVKPQLDTFDQEQ